MSAGVAALESAQGAASPNAGHSARAAWLAGTALGAALLSAGLRAGVAPAVVGPAAVFMVLAAACDVRSFRIPNWLTLPALGVALIASPWIGGTTGPAEALLGTGVGFGVLLVPYAVGGMGAGDVKASMALGAWLGPALTLGAAAWALLAAGSFGLLALALRGELLAFIRRWGGILVASLATRRNAYVPPATGTAAARGIPFAVALAVGLAAQWTGGSPW